MGSLDMVLERFCSIVIGDVFEQEQSTKNFKIRVVGIRKPKGSFEGAKKMIGDGIQIIELCGDFWPVWTSRIIEAINKMPPFEHGSKQD